MAPTSPLRLLLAAAALTSAVAAPGVEIPAETRLMQALASMTARHGTASRPVRNASLPVDINIALRLMQIIEVNGQEQQLKVVACTHTWWEDAALKWAEDTFDGVQSVVLTEGNIWKPDIVLLNSVSAAVALFPARMLVQSSGRVDWSPCHVLTAHCQVADDAVTLSCALAFGSWAYSAEQVTLSAASDRVDTTLFKTNPDFELYRTRASSEPVNSPWGAAREFDRVTFNIDLKRRAKAEEVKLPCDGGSQLTPLSIVGTMTALLCVLLIGP